MKKILKHFKANWYKYAFETFVVIIGVLIAFTLNDWNESIKLKAVEVELLEDIRADLIKSKNNIQTTISLNQFTLDKYEILLDHINQDLPYSNSLDSAFSLLTNWASPYPHRSAYETLKSNGLEIIRSDSLKQAIIDIYETRFAFFIEDYDREEWLLHESIVIPFTSKHIRYLGDNTARPNNFEEIKSNDEFRNILSILIRARRNGISIAENTKLYVDALIEMVDKELGK